MSTRIRAGLIAFALAVSCAKEQPRSGGDSSGEYQAVALAFVKALAARDYPAAYALTSSSYRKTHTTEAMQAAFERVVSTDWKSIGPVVVGETMTDWPDKQAGDAGWVYVTVGGDVYSEAVTVVIMREDADLRVRSAEFGRP